MKHFRFVCLFVFALVLMAACQRFEKPEHQTGLDKDSRSYSYVGYPESKMRQVALTVDGVQDARVKYDGRNILLYIVPDRRITRDQYRDLADRVYRRVSQAALLNPFHVKIVELDQFLQME
jgi:hypothetical protein